MFPLPPSSGSARDAASAADAHTSHPREARVLRMGRFLPESAGRLSPPFLQPLQAGDGRRKVGGKSGKRSGILEPFAGTHPEGRPAALTLQARQGRGRDSLLKLAAGKFTFQAGAEVRFGCRGTRTLPPEHGEAAIISMQRVL